MNTLRKIWRGAEGSMWADMDNGSKCVLLITMAFCLGMALFIGHAAELATQRLHDAQCITDSECEGVAP